MKVKTVVIAVAAALYSAGAAYAVVPKGGDYVHTLEKMNATAEDIKKFNKDNQFGAQSSMLQNDGLNVQINRQAQRFQKEDGITGEHVYLVRLNKAPVTIAAKDSQSALAQSLSGVKSDDKLFSKGKATLTQIAHYEARLRQEQRLVAQTIDSQLGGKKIRHQFTKAINGFSMTLSQNEAEQVSLMAGVAQVMRLKDYELLSDEGPKHIGADKVWSGEAPVSGAKYKGEGQIIGIIDTGVNTDHPSFADIGDDGYDHNNPWGKGVYVGDCVEDAELIQCNDKLIGVRSYSAITDNFEAMRPGWPAIGEDYQGHGSHVASTAAGNVILDAPFLLPNAGENADGEVIKEAMFPMLSGVAPHANIVSYQVCNPTNDQGFRGCPGEALVAGIEDAIADGVDVINFSIGGADSNVWADAVQLAFLSAREAGISVAAAAGNSGQACAQECFGAIDNSSPWLAQVAATTHGRTIAVETAVEYAGFIDDQLGNEVPSWSDMGLVGGSMNSQEMTGVVVWAKDYQDVDGNKDYNGYCTAEYPVGTFDNFKDGSPIPGAADGSTNVFVVCQRHDPNDPAANARTAKVANVKAGGADGFIMFNRVAAQGTPLTEYELPSVHFTNEQWEGKYVGYNHPDNTDGLEDWIDSYSEKGHMITVKPTVIERRVNTDDADWLATFSSRGPSFSNRDVMAPTLAAPGVNIYAAYSDEQPFTSNPYGTDYNAISGTSMASPHVAGAMALLRQAHPEWSATEIQSALSMTADNVVKYHRLNDDNDAVGHAEIYRAGAGRINVSNAVKAGLVMDESAENFKAADPNNGGTPHKLNLPNLIDLDCKPECQWVRTVKATRDGNWTVDASSAKVWAYDLHDQIEQQGGVSIDVYPQSFSLKAGETQTIVVKASVMETKDIFSNGEAELHANILFKADNADIPDSHWPVAFKNNNGELPRKLDIEARADNDSFKVSNMAMPLVDSPVATTYGLTKATRLELDLKIDDDKTFPWRSGGQSDDVNPEDILDDSTQTVWVSVPENTKRFVVHGEELIGDSPRKGSTVLYSPLVYVGKDYNGNGIADMQDEIVCVSNHKWFDNFCDIADPESGEYWTVFYNSNYSGYEGTVEKWAASYAVVPNTPASNLDANLVANGETADLTISWQQEMDKDDIYYGMVDVGSSSVNSNNIGQIPVKLKRGDNRVTVGVPQTGANVGDEIPVTFALTANNSGMDRTFSIEAQLPAGLSVNLDDIYSSNDDITEVSLEGRTVTITGVQQDTSKVEPSYKITTNISDEMCRMPNVGQENTNGFLNLAQFGIMPIFSGFDERNNVTSRRGIAIPTDAFFNGAYSNYKLYNNYKGNNTTRGLFNIHGNGWIDLEGAGTFFPTYYHLPFDGFPHSILAPLWRGWDAYDPRGFDDPRNNDVFAVGLNGYDEGISLASTQSGIGIIQYSNAKDYGEPQYDRASRSYVWQERDNNIDMQVVFDVNTSFVKGKPEIIMAYNDIDWADTNSRGVIGVKGYKGMIGIFGPLEMAALGEEYAWQDVQSKVSNDLLVCYDYVGPESSQFEVTAWTKVTESAAGQALQISGTAKVDGMADMPIAHQIAVSSNISMGELGDVTTVEETPVTIDVIYADETMTKNTIVASGEGFTFSVEEHMAGGLVTLMPNKDFIGETNVTVTVADIDNPNDAVSRVFTMTVTNVDDAPVAQVAEANITITEGDTVTLDASASHDVDGDAISYLWSGNGTISDETAASTTVSGLSAGSHTFTVTVSDGVTEVSEEVVVTVNAKVVTAPVERKKSSSGSLMWLLSGLSLLLVRRKKHSV